MLLRITYCNTKRFLKSSIHSLKSYFAGGYQRLPKTPPCSNPFSCTGSGGRHATHFNHSYREPDQTTTNHSCTITKINNHYEAVDIIKKQENGNLNNEKDDESSYSKCLVTRKLKELEMMDQNNADLVVDVQEVLHCYSLLTCPVYRNIVDKFFVDVYSGTFVLSRVENSVSGKLLI